MYIDISHLSLQARSANIQLWLDQDGPEVHMVEFSTFDELWCQAHFYWLDAQVCPDELQAFVRLWQCHFEQGEEFCPRGADLKLFFFSFEANGGFGHAAVFTQLSEDDWLKETHEVTTGIREAIARVRRGEVMRQGSRIEIPPGPRMPADPNTYWGIFENGQRVADETDYTFAVPGEYLAGLAIRNVWNQRELLIRTTTTFCLFTWSTGA